MTKNKIKFIGDENYYKLIDEFTICIVKDKDLCNKTPNLCMFTDNDSCNLILPKQNLITNKENESIYFGKMADELIRYSRIKSFILQPQSFLSFGNIGYNLRENEIILLQSLLTQEYFESLEPAIINTYVKYNSYDETEPILTQTYENSVNQEDIYHDKYKKDIECKKHKNEKITSAIWNTCFPENFSEIEYSKNIQCTFDFISDIIEKKTGEKLQANRIKNVLYNEYKKYLVDYPDKIIDILIIEGKKTLGDQVKAGLLMFSNFLYSDNYFLTPFDIWLLVTKYEIPTVFISSKYILQTNYEKNIFVAYGDINDKFCFICIPGLRYENIPGYKIIESDKNEIFISLEDIKNPECSNNIKKAINEQNKINDYLLSFKKITTTTYKQKKPKKIIVEEDILPNENEIKKEEILLEDIQNIEKSPSPAVSEKLINVPKKKRGSRKAKEIVIKGDKPKPKQTRKNVKN